MASFVDLVSGGFKKVAAAVAGGVSNANKIAQLDSNGQWPQSMMPNGIGPDVENATASEALSAGDLINIWDDAGTIKFRKADASDPTKPANAYASAAISQSVAGDGYYSGTNSQVSGLTPGAPVYLSDSAPGGVTSTPPSAAGSIVQRVGWATSASSFIFNPHPPVELS